MKIYLNVRKLHRLLVLVMIFATLLMSMSGLVMRYSFIANKLNLDMFFWRSLHNVASPFFAIALLLMMISGSVMYFYPLIVKRKSSD